MAKKCASMLLFLAVLVATSSAAPQGGNSNAGVIPPHAKYKGLSYGEWETKWWQAAYDVPVVGGRHPLLNGGAFGGEDGVLFLAAVVGAPTTIEVTIPAGTPLFLPVIN